MDKKVKVVLSGPMMKVDQLTPSGRMYPKEVFEREIRRLQTKADEGALFATVDNDSTQLELSKIAGCVRKLTLEDDEIQAEIELFQTSPAAKIRALLSAGEVELKPSGYGTLKDGVVQDDYRMSHVAIIPKANK